MSSQDKRNHSSQTSTSKPLTIGILAVGVVAIAAGFYIKSTSQSGNGPMTVPVDPQEMLADLARNEPQVYADARQFHEMTLSVEERANLMIQHAQRGDPHWIKVLRALGDMDDSSRLNISAILALGRVQQPEMAKEAESYLKQKLYHPNLEIRCAAIESYGWLLKDGAVTELTSIVKRYRLAGNYTREESDAVRFTTAKVLGGIGSPKAIEVLKSELKWLGRNVEETLVDYGSVVVKELGRIGTIEARESILTYADQIAKTSPENPFDRDIFKKKVDEARKIAGKKK
jgi:hypothetical protein